RVPVHAGVSPGPADGALVVRHAASSAYDMTPVPPLGLPAVISLAFWGGVWGAVIWPLLRHAAGHAYWLRAVLIGAVVPSAVSLFVVLPLKGMPVAGGWDPHVILGALMLNGAWGLGGAVVIWLSRIGA